MNVSICFQQLPKRFLDKVWPMFAEVQVNEPIVRDARLINNAGGDLFPSEESAQM